MNDASCVFRERNYRRSLVVFDLLNFQGIASSPVLDELHAAIDLIQ
jgi:hypothetical protein